MRKRYSMSTSMQDIFFDSTIMNSYAPEGKGTIGDVQTFARDFPADAYKIIETEGSFEAFSHLSKVWQLNITEGTMTRAEVIKPFNLNLTSGLQLASLVKEANGSAPIPLIDSERKENPSPVYMAREFDKLIRERGLVDNNNQVSASVSICTSDGFRILDDVMRSIFRGLLNAYIVHATRADLTHRFTWMTATEAQRNVSINRMVMTIAKVDILRPSNSRTAMRSILPFQDYMKAIRTSIHVQPASVADAFSRRLFHDAFYPYFVFSYLYKMTQPSATLSLNTKMLALVGSMMYMNYCFDAIDKRINTFMTTGLLTFVEALRGSFIGNDQKGPHSVSGFYRRVQDLSDKNARDAIVMSEVSNSYKEKNSKLMALSHNLNGRHTQLAAAKWNLFWVRVFTVFVILTVVALILLHKFNIYKNSTVFFSVNGGAISIASIIGIVQIVKNI